MLSLILKICFFFVFLDMSNAQVVQIKVGLLIPNGTGVDSDVGFAGSAGAVVVALRKAIELKIYDPSLYNISFTYYFDQCDETLSAGYAARMIMKENVSAILGPVCASSARVVGALAAYKKIPIFGWGVALSAEFANSTIYQTTQALSGTVRGTLISLSNVIQLYNWTQIGFIWNVDTSLRESIPICGDFSNLIEAGSTYIPNNTEVFTRQVVNTSVAGFQSVLTTLRSRARIIVACLETQAIKRNLIQAAAANDMLGPEYVYLLVQTNAIGFGNPPFWQAGDSSDDQIKEAAKSVLILDKFVNDSSVVKNVQQEIVTGVREWPFYCRTCSSNANSSNLAVYLGDAFLTYMLALNITYQSTGISQLKNGTAVLASIRNGSLIIPSIDNSKFNITKGTRLAFYSLVGLNANGIPTTWSVIQITLDKNLAFDLKYKNASTSIWANRLGQTPLSEPICGFSNEKCLASPLAYTLISVGGVFLFVIIVFALCILIYVCQLKQHRRLNALWQIPYILLDRHDDRTVTNTARSQTSTQSSQSQSSIRKNTEKTEFLHYRNEVVVATKHSMSTKWTTKDEEEFRKMRRLDHPNLNRFIGVSVFNNSVYFLWDFCSRGSIVEVIEAHSARIDAQIMTGMIKDVIEGLFYIHKSSFAQHGTLSARRCIVGDRFEVKIQMYGLTRLKSQTFRSLNDHKIVAKVSAANYPLTRPTLELDHSLGIEAELVNLIRKCWAEDPIERPNIEFVRSFVIQHVLQNRSINVMDHIFALMENNATDLERDVQMRRVELTEEKKRADLLLYRMMPRSAADLLKLGLHVQPEVFDGATVFFSDIVSFTVLASKSTPLQIIDFLNDVYTLTDNVIEKHDAYKVETIGDGLHVVSGIPKRNGHRHVKAIADMAIDFQREIRTLRLAHLPNSPIKMRMGVHSGSCVAGIVGMTAPRFCVFGDTVNVAAKMEAGGEAGRIHITEMTKHLIQTHYPKEYVTTERGEVLIKGIGTQRTWWLVPPEEQNHFDL